MMTLTSKKLVIVDDSPLIRRVVSKAAVQAGFDPADIRQAGNGQEALELVKESEPDVLLLDINMPVMDGEEFMEEVDRCGQFKKMSVIVVSTEVNAARLLRIAGFGAIGRLKKPFEPEELQTLLARVQGEAA